MLILEPGVLVYCIKKEIRHSGKACNGHCECKQVLNDLNKIMHKLMSKFTLPLESPCTTKTTLCEFSVLFF